MNRIAAIYNVFDGCELLEGSIKCLVPHVDEIIIVWQDVSNFGETFSPLPVITSLDFPIITYKYNPAISQSGFKNETRKRDIGLQLARMKECTHFLFLDVDEFYQDFGAAKQLYLESGHAGSVVKLHTYFKKPILRVEEDEKYFVPFIHELKTDTRVTDRQQYPFYVDPTRSVNEKDVVELPVFMEHFSWCRKDIGMKVRNSSLKAFYKQSPHMKEYNRDLKAGDYLEPYKCKLIEVPDYFNINAML